MNTSQRAITAAGHKGRPIALKEAPECDRPLSEQFRIIARQWADEEAAAALMEETKTTTLEKLKAKLIGTSDLKENKAERLAKCTPEWEEFLTEMCAHRAKATRLKVQMEYIRIKHWERNNIDANSRSERRL